MVVARVLDRIRTVSQQETLEGAPWDSQSVRKTVSVNTPEPRLPSLPRRGFYLYKPSISQKRCWDRRQTVNLVSAGGLVEQSNAAKNNAVDKLAGSAAGRLAGWLAADAAGGWLAG